MTQTQGSIGYVELAYALQNKMIYTHMVNKDGKTVQPGGFSVQAAAANADWSSVPGYGVILANQPGAGSWPMTAATFILVPKQPTDAAAAAEALKFFAWAYAKGEKMADELDYVPMPKEVIERSREALGERSQGFGRQAALYRDDAVTMMAGVAAVAARSYCPPAWRAHLVRRPVDRLSGRSGIGGTERLRGSGPGGHPWLTWRCRTERS